MKNGLGVGLGLLISISLFVGCSSTSKDADNKGASKRLKVEAPEVNWIKGETSTDNAPTEGEFKVAFETTAGNFTMHVHRDWSPRGAERFYQLVKSNYFNGSPFYRVMPGFIVQFGMCGDPAGTKYWDQSFPDEPVKQTNQVGLVSYAKAGPDTRSTQLFINYGDNSGLDGQQFSPFAEVIEGMDKVQAINAEYAQAPQQGMLARSGNKYVIKEFPNIDFILKASIVEGSDTTKSSTE